MTQHNKSVDAGLKPCPFCGDTPVVLTTREDDAFERCAEVRCDNCGIAIGDEYRSDAIELWNTRARSPKARARTALSSARGES